MIAGMGIVYFFLSLLIVVTKLSMGTVARFDAILPQDAPKKKRSGRRRKRGARDRSSIKRLGGFAPNHPTI